MLVTATGNSGGPRIPDEEYFPVRLGAAVQQECPPQGQPDGFQRELARFLRGHLGCGPGLLWPEHEDGDPADWDRPWADRLAAGLTRLLGRPVHHVPGTAARDTRDDLLVLQATGGSGWQLRRPGTAAAGPRPLRLRGGEALYVPAGCPAAVQQKATARHLRFVIGADSPG